MIDLGRPLVIYGAGRFGQDLCRAVRRAGGVVAGFVVSSVDAGTPARVLDVPVRSIFGLPSDWRRLCLLCGVFNREVPFTALVANAREAGFAGLIMPWTLAEQFGDMLGWRYWLAAPSRIAWADARVSHVKQRLADAESRRMVEAIRGLRAGVDLEFSAFRSSERQYFNALTLGRSVPGAAVYVDCGAYTGDSFRTFIASSECSAAYLFEPDSENFRLLTRSVEGVPVPVHCLPLAVSNRHRLVGFSSGNGEASMVSDAGGDRAVAAPLDAILATVHVDFLKIDVEGADLEVLQGASRLIARSRPVIAISLYHKPEDLWEIPLTAFDLCEDYDFFVRQHFYNSFDSVLYAIPCERATDPSSRVVSRGV